MTAVVPPPAPLAPPRPPRAATFSDAMRAERAKLTSVRSTWITLLVAAVLGIGFGALIAHLSANNYASGNRFGNGPWRPVTASFHGLTIAQLAIAVLGCLVVTSEYGTGMIRTSLTATPRRGRFLAAKATVFTAVALVVGEIIAFAAFFAGQASIGSSAPQAHIGGHDVLRAVIGGGLYLAAIGLLACLVGALLRNTAAAISAVVALLFVLPGVVEALPSSLSNPISEWWPTNAGSQIYTVARDSHTLAAWSGFGVLIGFTAIVFVAALALLRRRDA